MKILVVSNLFPPFHIGGYEIGCKEIADRLHKNGHNVCVLTSSFSCLNSQASDDTDGYRIVRKLLINFSWDNSCGGGRFAHYVNEIRNQRLFRQILSETKPDVVYFWNLNGLSWSLVHMCKEKAIACAFYIFDEWPILLNSNQTLMKRLIDELFCFFGMSSILPNKNMLANMQFGSRYLKGKVESVFGEIKNSQVVYWGLKDEWFEVSSNRCARGCGKLLFVGQIARHKGVHRAIEALAIVIDRYGIECTLDIVGPIVDDSYFAELKDLIRLLGLTQSVNIVGSVDREMLKTIYLEHDILIFPSVWEEPFGITILEAMASGLVVICSATGGSLEIVESGDVALKFVPDNAEQCAKLVADVIRDDFLRENIRCNAGKMVKTKYRIQKTYMDIESHLIMCRGKL